MARHVFRLTYLQSFRGRKVPLEQIDTLLARDAAEACDRLSEKAMAYTLDGGECTRIAIRGVEHVARLTM